MKDSVYKNNGGKYLSSHGARIFASQKQGGKYLSSRRSSDFLLRKKQGGMYAG